MNQIKPKNTTYLFCNEYECEYNLVCVMKIKTWKNGTKEIELGTHCEPFDGLVFQNVSKGISIMIEEILD